MDNAVIFGGHGFIGQHYARYLLEEGGFKKVILADITSLDIRFEQLKKYLNDGRIVSHPCDVRDSINLDFPEKIDLICNFAAVHREPGHNLHEYYDTNLSGAQNVCNWAEKVGCNKVVFTSSIAPYGPTESPKSEYAIPNPVSAYGGSKLAAEKMHETWQAKDISVRKLVIVRPGVVFGAGERGNVSRLIKAVIKRYFFYTGNKSTRKAGTYVKELCSAIHWVLEGDNEQLTIFNMSMNPGPTVEDYVDTICKVAGIKRNVLRVPFIFLFLPSLVIEPLAKIFGINQPISPVRLKKLVKSNNIIPQVLADRGYIYRYTFEEALADWRSEAEAEW